MFKTIVSGKYEVVMKGEAIYTSTRQDKAIAEMQVQILKHNLDRDDIFVTQPKIEGTVDRSAVRDIFSSEIIDIPDPVEEPMSVSGLKIKDI